MSWQSILHPQRPFYGCLHRKPVFRELFKKPFCGRIGAVKAQLEVAIFEKHDPGSDQIYSRISTQVFRQHATNTDAATIYGLRITEQYLHMDDGGNVTLI